jgi:hypothetical protein
MILGLLYCGCRGKETLSLHPIPETADLHTPEKPLLLWKSYVGISAV